MRNVEMKSRLPSNEEIKEILLRMCDVLRFTLVDSNGLIYLIDKENPDIFKSYFYLKLNASFQRNPYVDIFEDIIYNYKFFRDRTINPFYGCRSLEEIKIKLDLMKD